MLERDHPRVVGDGHAVTDSFYPDGCWGYLKGNGGGDRSDAQAGAPLIYVSDPRGVAEQLGSERARPGRGVLLLGAMSGELDDVESEGGIRFVPRSRALLDAFSSPGRDPDKAEDLLRAIWEDASRTKILTRQPQ